MYIELDDIYSIRGCTKVKEIKAGWSDDKKYFVQCNGENILVRVSYISLFEKKKSEFEFIKLINSLSFKMSKAKDFGVCNDGKSVYIILSWVEGENLVDVVSKLSKEEQYSLGKKAGKILKGIHSLKVSEKDIAYENMKDKILRKLNDYEKIAFRLDNDEKAIDFIRKNINKVAVRPVTYKHRDFHLGNLILTPEKEVGVIDFNRWGVGDPYEEFLKIQSFDVEISIPFSVGQIDGYFDENPPKEFWDTLALYVAYSSLTSITWAISFGEKEILGMQKRGRAALEDYNYFEDIIPKWYREYVK